MRIYIGLGSNLDCPPAQLRQALRQLAHLPGTRLVKSSRWYRNPARDFPGYPAQPDYVNAVAALETRLPPRTLLYFLFKIETKQHRVRQRPWGPRTLDLDLLLYGHRQINRPQLTLPHPALHERAFVLYPLAHLDPNLVIPGCGRLSRLRSQQTSRWLRVLPAWRKWRFSHQL